MPVVAVHRGSVGWLTLDRPERAHAYDRALLAELEAGLGVVEGCTVVIVQSTGDRAFCAGADLHAMKEASVLGAFDLYSQRVFGRIARMPAVTIAAVQGAAVAGGFELALACDLRVAGPNATFSLPETKLGLLPGAGGCTRLGRLVGAGRTKAMILGGERLDAETALRWGVVNRLDADPRAAAEAWAEEIATRDPAALVLAKEVLDAELPAASLARERAAEAILYSRKSRS